MKIILAAEALGAQGGIGISVAALKSHLMSLGHEVWTSSDSFSAKIEPDLVWAHGWQTGKGQSIIKDLRRNKKSKFWVQLHDYKDFCLTSRKAIGSNTVPCQAALSQKCFVTHMVSGCGRGRNPLALVRRYHWMCRRLDSIRSADRVFVFSDAVANVAIKNEIQKDLITKTPPWATFASGNQALPVGGEKSMQHKPKILWVGRMVREKGPHYFVRGLYALKQRLGPEFTGVMVGDGPERKSLEGLAQELGVSDLLQFRGWLDRDSLNLEYSHAHHLVFTSLWPEPFGLVGTEAMAWGVPVIAFDRGGVKEWCRPEMGGILMQQPNAEILFEHQFKLLQEPEFRRILSEQSRKNFKMFFSVEVQKAFLKKLIEKSIS